MYLPVQESGYIDEKEHREDFEVDLPQQRFGIDGRVFCNGSWLLDVVDLDSRGRFGLRHDGGR